VGQQEKGRIPVDLKTRLDVELRSGATGLVLADLTAGVVEAMTRVPRTCVPDMPDRIIAATALHLSLPLMTRDHKI
jgi:PIN domain nuclease of toxin-antitoxin system